MKSKTPTVTVAIPAYNEEVNIKFLIDSLLKQQKKKYYLKEICVFSDGSTDSTTSIVQTEARLHPLIKLVENKTRKGKIYRLNEIFSSCKSDILVILDADINLVGDDFLDKLVSEIIKDSSAKMVAVHQIPKRPDNFIGKIFYAPHYLWDQIRLSIPNYDHVQNFYGAATAYKGSFIRLLRIPKEVKEERLFLYLTAKENNGFRYSRRAEIEYWPSTSLGEYLRPSTRTFGKRQPEIEKIFGKDVMQEYIIPRKYKVKGIVKSFFSNPFYTIIALAMMFLFNKLLWNEDIRPSFWNIDLSTKKPFLSEKKRINISSYDDLKNPYYAGGGAVAIHELAKKMSKKYDVVVISWDHCGKKSEKIDGVSYKRFGFKFIPPKIGMLIFQLMLPFFAITQKYDIWLESFGPPFTTSFLPVYTKRKVVGIVHMLAAEDMKRKYKLFPFNFIEKAGIRKYKNIIATSKYLQTKIKQINSNAEIKVISNGVNLPRTVNNKSKKNILYLGRIEVDQKGLNLLISAYKKYLDQSKSNYDLVIAGSGTKDQVAKLKRIISKQGLQEKVHLLGRVKGKLKEQLFKESTIMVIPSRFETHSMVALEAMAHGVPIVCFDIEGLKWLNNKIATKIKPYKIEDLSRAFIQITDRKMEAKESNELGRQYVKNLSWDNIAEKYGVYLNNLFTA